MNDLMEQALLFDYYGDLLTEQQRKIYQEVYFDDYSPSEVAKGEGVSRQGIHDMLRRTLRMLDDYEKKLGMVEKHRTLRRAADEIEGAAMRLRAGDEAALDEIREQCRIIREG